jgi:adenylate kinase family enzyme
LTTSLPYRDAVPLLTVDAPLQPSQRIVVAGISGAGKTTTAAAIATRLQLPHVEIDALFHGPGWTERESFLDDVKRFVAEPRWVTEWQYPAARSLLLERAELMVWLDLPTRTSMWRVVSRTVRRRVRRTSLWNGNLEPPLRTFFSDPEHIVRWTWAHRDDVRTRVAAVVASHPDLPVVRLTSGQEVQRWLSRL